MPDYVFTLNQGTFSTLAGLKSSYVAFSGDGTGRNNAADAAAANHGPIPPGRYHVVERPSGGRLGPVRDFLLGRDEWFALFRDDGSIDDETFVSGVRRGEFRLHPLGPRRMSTGCIVLQYPAEFTKLRAELTGAATTTISGSARRSYGTIDVLEEIRLPPLLVPTRGNRGVA
jgi:hypothetical protein